MNKSTAITITRKIEKELNLAFPKDTTVVDAIVKIHAAAIGCKTRKQLAKAILEDVFSVDTAEDSAMASSARSFIAAI